MLSLEPTSASLAVWKQISLEYFKMPERKGRRNSFKQNANSWNMENERNKRARIITKKKQKESETKMTTKYKQIIK